MSLMSKEDKLYWHFDVEETTSVNVLCACFITLCNLGFININNHDITWPAIREFDDAFALVNQRRLDADT